jgi:four helix bundle protein
MTQKDLEERLVQYSILLMKVSEDGLESIITRHLSGQLSRAGTSAALNYSESRAAESKKDFVHKLRLVLKELRETSVCLSIFEGAGIVTQVEKYQMAKKESNELISILVATLKSLGRKD